MQNLSMSYTIQERTNILRELIAMAYADEHLKREEIEFIKAIASRMDVGMDQLQKMLENPTSKPVKPPQEFTKRIIHFHRLMLMMHIDGKVEDSELQLLHEIALSYGIRGVTVNKLLATMSRYPHGEIPAQELLSIHAATNN